MSSRFMGSPRSFSTRSLASSRAAPNRTSSCTSAGPSLAGAPARDARVRQRQAVRERAQQGAREVQLAAVAERYQSRAFELRDDGIGAGLYAGLTNVCTPTNVRQLAERFARAQNVEQAALRGDF